MGVEVDGAVEGITMMVGTRIARLRIMIQSLALKATDEGVEEDGDTGVEEVKEVVILKKV